MMDAPLHSGLAHKPQPTSQTAAEHRAEALLHSPGQGFPHPHSSQQRGDREWVTDVCKVFLFCLPSQHTAKHRVPNPEPRLFGKYSSGVRNRALFPSSPPCASTQGPRSAPPENADLMLCMATPQDTWGPGGTLCTQEGPPTAGVTLNTTGKQTHF